LPAVGTTVEHDPSVLENQPFGQVIDNEEAPLVLTMGFDISPPPTNIAAGDDADAAAYLEAVREAGMETVSFRRRGLQSLSTGEISHPDMLVAGSHRHSITGSGLARYVQQARRSGPVQPSSPLRDWEIARQSRPTIIVWDDDLDLNSVNMASSRAGLDYGFASEEGEENGPSDVMYFNNTDYVAPSYYDTMMLDGGTQFRKFNDTYTQVNYVRLTGQDWKHLKNEVQARKQLSRSTNVALQNYKKIVKGCQTLAVHLSSASEQFFSVQDWIAKVFTITDADRDAEKIITDEFMFSLPSDFIPPTTRPLHHPTNEQQVAGDTDISPAPQRKQPSRFAKATGVPTPEGFLKHKHVNFSPGLTQEAGLGGQAQDDDIDEEIGDNDRDVLLSAQKHQAEIKAKRKTAVAGQTNLDLGTEDSPSSEDWRPSQDGDDNDDDDDDSLENTDDDDDDDEDDDETVVVVNTMKRQKLSPKECVREQM